MIKKHIALQFYMLKRPFDGFYAMKYERKGTLIGAALNFFLMWASISFSSQYSSIVVNQSYPLSHNSLRDGGILLLALVLWCVSNWSVTSLTDGEGRFVDIIMAMCYAMTPMILAFIPATILSNFLAEGEAAFYFLIIGVSIAWFVLLAFVGIVTVHNYSAGKALSTIFLTALALHIIVFLIALTFTLLQQLVVFVRSVYTELIFRH